MFDNAEVCCIFTRESKNESRYFSKVNCVYSKRESEWERNVWCSHAWSYSEWFIMSIFLGFDEFNYQILTFCRCLCLQIYKEAAFPFHKINCLWRITKDHIRWYQVWLLDLYQLKIIKFNDCKSWLRWIDPLNSSLELAAFYGKGIFPLCFLHSVWLCAAWSSFIFIEFQSTFVVYLLLFSLLCM